MVIGFLLQYGPVVSGYRGVRNQFAKLDELDVRVMRALHENGFSPHRLAKIFGVSRPHAKRIVRKEKWGWLL